LTTLRVYRPLRISSWSSQALYTHAKRSRFGAAN